GTASDLVVQVVLIAESMRLQAMMATYGIHTQTPHEVEPVQIWSPSQLVKVYEYLGVSKKLGLKGRPPRPIGALGTSKVLSGSSSAGTSHQFSSRSTKSIPIKSLLTCFFKSFQWPAKCSHLAVKESLTELLNSTPLAELVALLGDSIITLPPHV
ncbi:putative phosphorylase b kinase regulatory subunit beta, partial [Araneus ventricosus]